MPPFPDCNRKYLTSVLLGLIELPENGTTVKPAYQKCNENAKKRLKVILNKAENVLKRIPPR